MGIDVAQPIRSSGCPTEAQKWVKVFFCVFSPFLSFRRMGQNFDDYPGFQLKTTFMYYFAHVVS